MLGFQTQEVHMEKSNRNEEAAQEGNNSCNQGVRLTYSSLFFPNPPKSESPIVIVGTSHGRTDSALRILFWLANLEYLTADNFCALENELRQSIIDGLEHLESEKHIQKLVLLSEEEKDQVCVYCLDTKGAQEASKLISQKVQKPPRNERNSINLIHDIAVSEAMVGLIVDLGIGRLDTLLVGRRLRKRIGFVSRRDGYYPDGYIGFYVDDENRIIRHLFLEVDRGSEFPNQLRSKFHRLDKYYRERHRLVFNSNRLAVCVTVPDRKRLEKMCEVVREVNCCVRIFVGLHQEICDSRSSNGGWIDAVTGDSKYLLEKVADQERSQ
jgi:hypothetical protein